MAVCVYPESGSITATWWITINRGGWLLDRSAVRMAIIFAGSRLDWGAIFDGIGDYEIIYLFPYIFKYVFFFFFFTRIDFLLEIKPPRFSNNNDTNFFPGSRTQQRLNSRNSWIRFTVKDSIEALSKLILEKRKKYGGETNPLLPTIRAIISFSLPLCWRESVARQIARQSKRNCVSRRVIRCTFETRPFGPRSCPRLGSKNRATGEEGGWRPWRVEDQFTRQRVYVLWSSPPSMTSLPRFLDRTS